MTVAKPDTEKPGNGTVYSALHAHCSFPGIDDHNTALVEFVRASYPEHHLTITEECALPLEDFSKAGLATLDRVRDTDEGYLANRHFRPARERMSTEPGYLYDRERFVLFKFTYADVEYLIYHIHWRSQNDNASHFYILSPLDKQTIGKDGNSPLADRMIKDVVQWASEPHEEIYVYDGGWMKSKTLYKSVQKSSWDDVVLSPSVKASIIGDINAFFRNRSLYTEFNVPWKRGIILHGPPGNGKTVTIKALMNELGQHGKDSIPSLYVKSFENDDGSQYAIRQIFEKAREMAPCFLIFEDLDSLVTDELRSYFLNEVDGLESNDGILMLGSTNHLGKLDPAIAKRPSRFDRKYAFELPNADQRMLYAQYWQSKLKANAKLGFNDEAAAFIAKLTEDFSFAYMKELFMTSLIINFGDASEQIETDLEAAKENVKEEANKEADADAENKDEEKEKAEKARASAAKAKELLNIPVPKTLVDNKFVRTLHKQAVVLRFEMDSTEETSKSKIDT